MDLKQLVTDVKKAGKFKDEKQAKMAINSVFLSLRQRNVNEDAGGVKSFFSQHIKDQVSSKSSFEGVAEFLYGSESELGSILLNNLKVRVQCAYADVCDSSRVLAAVFSGLKKQLNKEESNNLGDKISDGDLEKMWKEA